MTSIVRIKQIVHMKQKNMLYLYVYTLHVILFQ